MSDASDEIRTALQAQHQNFVAALGSEALAGRFERVVLMAVMADPSLLAADRSSFWAACMKAAQHGLLPDGEESILQPYNCNEGTKENPRWVRKVSFQPMVKGIQKKARNSGEILLIHPDVVYSCDTFKVRKDENGLHLEHEYGPLEERTGDARAVYVIVKLKNGEKDAEVMTRADVEKVRNQSRAANKGPWVTWWDEMAKKSVIRRIAKRLPMSTDLDMLIRADDALIDLDAAPGQASEEAPKTEDGPSKTKALVAAHQTSNGAPPPEQVKAAPPPAPPAGPDQAPQSAPEEKKEKPAKQVVAEATADEVKKALAKLYETLKSTGLDKAVVKEYMEARWKKSSSKDLSLEEVKELTQWIEKRAELAKAASSDDKDSPI